MSPTNISQTLEFPIVPIWYYFEVKMVKVIMTAKIKIESIFSDTEDLQTLERIVIDELKALERFNAEDSTITISEISTEDIQDIKDEIKD